jgi:hypothetical protein
MDLSDKLGAVGCGCYLGLGERNGAPPIYD